MTLPQGWAETALGELGVWRGGGTPSKANAAFWTGGDIPWVSPKDMKSDHISDAEDHITAAAVNGSTTNLVGAGSILVVVRSGILRRMLPVAVTMREVALNQDLKALTPHDGVSAAFVALLLKSRGSEILHSAAKAGTTVDSLDFERLKQTVVSLPPLAEQRRIVAKLDALTTRLARARGEAERVLDLGVNLRTSAVSYIHRATTDAEKVAVSDLAEASFDGPFGSNLKSSDYVSAGVRVVRLENIGHLRFLSDKKSFVTNDKYASLTRHTLVGGDVLFSSFVDRNVRVCLFPEGEAATINKADCFAVRLDPKKCDRRFITYMLAAPETYEAIKAKVHGATRPRIGLRDLREFRLSVPSLAEQVSLAGQLDAAFARADRLEAEARKTLALIDRLEAAILARAFRGELVSQDPDDEPASVLLERIRARRAVEPQPRRGRRPKPAS